MKYVPLLTLALMIALPAHAQNVPAETAPPTDAPAPEAIAPVAEPEPEVSEPVAEPEPEVSEPVAEPEPEVSEPVAEPEPEVSAPADAAGGLGTASPEAQTQQDLQGAEAEATVTAEEAVADDADSEDGEGGGTLSAAERLSSMTGAQGVPWTFPVTWSNNLSVDSMRPQHRPTYNPFYSMTFSIAPRYVFSSLLSIGARMSLDVEFTDSNLTPETRDLEWGDLQLDVQFALPWRLGGIGFAVTTAIRLPTSQLSRGQNRVLGPSIRLAGIKAFDVANGLVMGGFLGYTLWTHSSGARRFRDGTAGAGSPGNDSTGRPIQTFNAQTDCDQTSLSADVTALGNGTCNGGNQVRHQPSIVAFVSLVPVNHLTLSVSFAAFWLVNRGHSTSYVPAGNVVTADGQPLGVGDNSPTHTTTVTSFSASIGWDWTSWLTTTLGYSTLSFYPDSDGSFENFIYNENSQFNLSVAFRPSALVSSLKAAEEESEEEVAAAALQQFAF